MSKYITLRGGASVSAQHFLMFGRDRWYARRETLVNGNVDVCRHAHRSAKAAAKCRGPFG